MTTYLSGTALDTARLTLRHYRHSDVPRLVELLRDRTITQMTLRIPYPYTERDGLEWVDYTRDEIAQGRGISMVITQKDDFMLVGAIGLSYDRDHQRAELGYWLGSAFRGLGYATEASQALIGFGFEQFQLNRIYATCFTENIASARVMQKCGMQFEGTLRQHTYHKITGTFRDIHMYGILREDVVKGA